MVSRYMAPNQVPWEETLAFAIGFEVDLSSTCDPGFSMNSVLLKVGDSVGGVCPIMLISFILQLLKQDCF